jgi:hypothetical protein
MEWALLARHFSTARMERYRAARKGEITKVLIKLRKRCESPHPDKVIAELTLGFWVSLFNSTLQPELWKSLRLVFAHCPKHSRQRRAISACLNQARDLRNRIFHHEPLLWLTPDLITQHENAAAVIAWIDPQLRGWLAPYDRVPALWHNSFREARSTAAIPFPRPAGPSLPFLYPDSPLESND